MQFQIIKGFSRYSNNQPTVSLRADNWNDYSYYTTYEASYSDEKMDRYELGYVRIGFFGQSENLPTPFENGEKFEKIGDNFFSLGASEDYYENLNELGKFTRDEILYGLNDIAKDEKIFSRAIKEDVTAISLLRGITPRTVTGQYRRIANGGSKLIDYSFEFAGPSSNKKPPVFLSFDVEPESYPPTNIHVLIGRNGSGKTYLLNNMINSLIDEDGSSKYGKFNFNPTAQAPEQQFANLISVSFSAFDESEPREQTRNKSLDIQYSYIGLKRIPEKDKKIAAPKSTTMLNNEFFKSIQEIKQSKKVQRWKNGIAMLESDTNFKEVGIQNIIDISDEIELKATASDIFKNLSSGHKIVLLTITRLIEKLQEKSLVLIDEPEGHLHPPLLSAFIRALSELLWITNGVAIIATHSPVILQEVPKNCVWKIRRANTETAIERLTLESFGENVGVLTNEVFGLEVTESGFYTLLKEVVDEMKDYDEVLNHFKHKLGKEAKAIVMALCSKYN